MKADPNTLSLVSLTQRLYRLYQPYFGLRKNKKWRTISALAMITISIMMAFTMNLINQSMTGFIAVIGPSVTYATYFGAFGYFLGTIILYAAFCYVNTLIGGWLAESLTYAIGKKMTKKWLLSNAFIGNKLATNAHTQLDIAKTLSHDNQHLNTKVLDLINHGLIVLGNFVVGAIGLYAMSIPLSITVFATTITIPGYLLISSLLYALLFNYVSDRTGSTLTKRLAEQAQLDSDFHYKVHHVDSHAEAIAFKKGQGFELKSLLDTLKNNRAIKKTILHVQSALVFLNIINQEFSQYVAFILAAPSVIAGKLGINGLFQLGNDFSFVLQPFTWKAYQFEYLSECEVELQKIEALKGQIEDWALKAKQTQGNVRFSSKEQSKNFDHIEIKNLFVNIPGGKEIFHDYNVNIPKKRRTLLEGASGRGKTSLIRTLSNLNIHATGEINGLPENVEFMPSEPYFPHNKTLLETILYPSEAKATPMQREKIIHLMQVLGFDQSKIQLLDEVKDWYGSILSDGERKRLMIISMIIKDPEVIVMDEATRGIDPPTKIKAENTINKYLPDRTILLTDHNPSEEAPFYQHKIVL